MRFAITYETEYRYEQPVHDQHNTLRLKPQSNGQQRLESFELHTEPAARIYARSDYFGTEVLEFSLPERHETLRIRALSRVVTTVPETAPDPDWAELEQGLDEEAVEMLLPGPSFADSEGMLRELAAEVRQATPRATLRRLVDWLPERFEYRQGATYVGSTISDLLEGGAGVCQDFVHLGLELLRLNGIPTRYVSGYLFAPNGESEESAEVQTHAWLEAFLTEPGGGGRWVGADPTNSSAAAEAHVKIGHGRAYADVPPIRGVYRGDAAAENDAHVTMRTLPE